MTGGDGFLHDRYYCAHCLLLPGNAHGRYVSVGGVRTHLMGDHDFESREACEEGRDFYKGWQARQVFNRRQAEAERQGNLVGWALAQAQPYTVDDFLNDCVRSKDIIE